MDNGKLRIKNWKRKIKKEQFREWKVENETLRMKNSK